jgi:hypothetical protein
MNFAARYISNVYNPNKEEPGPPKACRRLIRGRKVFRDKNRRIRFVVSGN